MAQFYFVISENGQICTYDNSDETVNIIASSFDKFIENYAMNDLIKQKNKYEHPFYYDIIDNDSFETLTKDYLEYKTASDDYNKWLSIDNLIISKETWYDKPSFSIHVYGENSNHCEKFIKMLKDKKII